MFMFSALAGALGVGGTGAATAVVPGIAGAATVVPAVSSGLTIGSVLQGVATVGGLVSSIAAGNAEADAMEAAAIDAQGEQALETLQGVDRRRSLKAAAAEAIGEADAAYAASGVDLSFGTAAQARTDMYREADLGISTDAGTTMTRLGRLQERASNYRRSAKRARIGGWVTGLTGAASRVAGMAERY